MKIKVNGIEMNYELAGQGACLVLIHGFSDNLTMWYNQVPVFTKQYQVLTYDTRGHGKTEMPEEDFSMELFADDLYALMQALDIEKACVLGYSMGGRIGLEFALKYPSNISGLVFANSGVAETEVQPSEEEMAAMMEWRQQMMNMIESGDIEALSDMMAEGSFSPGFRDKDPDVFQRYKDVKMQNDPKLYLPIMQAMMASWENPPDLSQLKCPALIIAGEHDGYMATDVADSMEKAISDATVVMMPTGHAGAIEAPEDFNQAVLEFMKRLN